MAGAEDSLALWQQAERARLVLLQRTAESHDRAVAVGPTARCRDYSATEIGYDSLMTLCRKRCRQVADRKGRIPVGSSDEDSKAERGRLPTVLPASYQKQEA
jgi:hypothetical protein